MRELFIVVGLAVCIGVTGLEIYNHLRGGDSIRPWLVSSDTIDEHRAIMWVIKDWMTTKAVEQDEEQKFNDIADMIDKHNPSMVPTKTPGVKK